MVGRSVTIKKNKIDLEHADLLEQRNAIYLLETSFPVLVISAFQAFSNLNPQDSILFIFGVALILIRIDAQRIKLTEQIRRKYRELNRLLQT
jgi:hypothetical protein